MRDQKQVRTAELTRKTKETEINVKIELGSRKTDIETGIGFFDHMLHALSFHGLLGLGIKASGDIHVDYHHVVEDTGIVLGKALRKAIGDSPVIVRFASAYVPMDETLALAAVDVSGRGGAFFDPQMGEGWVRDFQASLCLEFLKAFAREAGITLHARILCGDDAHHRLEAVFKALALSLKKALSQADGSTPSTKSADSIES